MVGFAGKMRAFLVKGAIAGVVVVVGYSLHGYHAQGVCDNYASHPVETDVPGGMPFNELSAETELPCRTAYARENSATNALHLGRILLASGDPQKVAEGFALVKASYEAGYVPAGYALSFAFKDGLGTPADLASALRTIDAVIAQDPPFAKEARETRGFYMMSSPDVSVAEEGLRIVAAAAPRRPELANTLGGSLAGSRWVKMVPERPYPSL